MRRRPPSYRAYLLRVWTPADDGGVRASIRDVGSGETHAFTDLARLTDWLNDELRTTPSRAASPAHAGSRRTPDRDDEPRRS